MIDRFEILASRARRLFSRTRWSARLLGLRGPERQAHGPGLLLVQIDGLGEEVLRHALARGSMPFLQRLVERDGYQIRRLYSGLPSNTPGFQAEFFYGERTAVPGFSFRDPATGRVRVLSDPGAASEVEARLVRTSRGLLRGGSSWSNVFTGGAAEPRLCASSGGEGAPLRGLTPLRMFTLLFWHGWSLFRILFNLVAVATVVLGDLARGRLRPREFLHELRYVPARVGVSAVLREIVTAGASIDAERGLPVIHVNFLGYDEHAHRRGPDSAFAHWSLRGIDHALRRVWFAAHRSRRRDYQVWIYSDHGQETCTPFRARHGRTVAETVNLLYRELRDGGFGDGAPPPRAAGEGRFPDAVRPDTRFRWVGHGLPRWITGWGRDHGDGGVRHPRDAPLVLDRGPIGSVHLPEGHDLPFREGLARSLSDRGGVPTVLLPDGAGGAIAYREGDRLHLPEDAPRLLGHDHPHLRAVAEDLVRLVGREDAGDLTLLGWSPRDPLSLQGEVGCHGGPGPRETSAFAILPPEVRALASFPKELRPSTFREMAVRTLDRRLSGALQVEVPRRRYHPPIPGRERDGSLTIPLRVMTYNVHGCRGIDGSYAPGRIARVIARERADVVCLQELDQVRTRSGDVDQAKFLAQRLQSDYQFHAVSEFDDGTFGNAVLSMLPLRMRRALPLPSAPRAKSAFNLWDRGALWVTLTVAGRDIHVINTHLSILQAERRLQAEALLGEDWLGHPDCRGPVILAGDFNAAPRSWTVRRIEERLRSVVPPDGETRALRTWSGRVPLRRIDHVLVSPEIEVLSVRVPRTRLSRAASDHLPLVVDLLCRFPAERAETDADALATPGSRE